MEASAGRLVPFRGNTEAATLKAENRLVKDAVLEAAAHVVAGIAYPSWSKDKQIIAKGFWDDVLPCRERATGPADNAPEWWG